MKIRAQSIKRNFVCNPIPDPTDFQINFQTGSKLHGVLDKEGGGQRKQMILQKKWLKKISLKGLFYINIKKDLKWLYILIV